MPIKDIHAKDAAKATSGKGFSKTTKTPTGKGQEFVSPAQAQECALAFSKAAESNLATQLNDKAGFLKGLDNMLDSAVEAIVAVEEDILSGNALERKLAERRSQYAFGCVQDAAVSLEFEGLQTLEVLAQPKSFPSVADTLKCIAPADKARLDQAVLTPSK